MSLDKSLRQQILNNLIHFRWVLMLVFVLETGGLHSMSHLQNQVKVVESLRGSKRHESP